MWRAVLSATATACVGLAVAAFFEAGHVADYMLIAASAISWIFTILYASRSRWRLLNAGRSLLYVMVSLSVVLTQNGASIFLGTNYPGRGVIRLTMYLALAVALSGMLITLWRIQKSDSAARFIEEHEKSAAVYLDKDE